MAWASLGKNVGRGALETYPDNKERPLSACCSTSAAGKPILTFFDEPGLAEHIRLTFVLGNVDFVDRRVSEREWLSQYKQYSPTGQCPLLEVDGQIMVQSDAIVQYAADRAGLQPTSSHDKLQGLMIVGKISDSRLRYRPMSVITSLESKFGVQDTGQAPKVLEELQAIIEKTQNEAGHIVGGRLTYVDVVVATFIRQLENDKVIGSLRAFPALQRVSDLVYTQPAVCRYVEERAMSKPPKLIYFVSPGKADAIRWTFAVGGVHFEDCHISQDEWRKMKASNPDARLPLLQLEGRTYAESTGILQYAAERAKLVPPDPIQKAHAWALVKTLDAVWDGLAIQTADLPAKSRLDGLQNILNTVPPMLECVDKLTSKFQDAEGHVVAGRLSFADLFIAMGFKIVIDLWASMLHDRLPRLPHMRKCHQMVHLIPAVRQFNYSYLKTVPRLIYADLSGHGESIRFLFYIAGVAFEDLRLSPSEWCVRHNEVSGLGQCSSVAEPYLDADGVRLAGVRSIICYVAERGNLQATTYLGRAKCDMVYNMFKNVLRFELDLWDMNNRRVTNDGSEADEHRQSQLLENLRRVERVAAEQQQPSRGYLVDNHLTWIDVYLAAELQWILDRQMLSVSDVHREFRALNLVRQTVYSHPALRGYLSRTTKCKKCSADIYHD